MNVRQWGFVLAVAATGLLPAGAQASVALAIGVTENPSDGLAAGFAYNYKSESEARRDAMSKCRDFGSARKAARNCHLIGSLAKGCAATAFDPDKDSSGIGWAMAATRELVERKALENCREAAPRGRREFCRIDRLRCDGDRAD